MKNTSMQVYKLATLLVLLLFVNCQKEDLTTVQEQETLTKLLYKQRKVSLNEIPNIKQKVIEKLNPEVFNRTEGSNQAIFDTENILEVIDTLDNINYSFQFRFPDTPSNVFYNLVVGETPTGEVQVPYVMRYECNQESLSLFISNNFNLEYFNGTMAIHKYTDFFGLGEFDRTETQCPPQFDVVGDPIPCVEETFNGGNGGGGSTSQPIGDGGNTGGTGGTGGGTANYGCDYLGLYIIGCEGTNTGILHPYGECNGPGKNGSDATISALWDCSGNNQNPTSPAPDGETGRTVDNDCPECDTPDGGVATNTELIFTARTALKHHLDLSPQAIEWIGEDDNQDFVIDTYEYLEANTNPFNNEYTDEAIGTAGLNTELKVDTFKLPEIDCNQIEHWQALAQNQASQSIIDKINNLPSSFFNDFEIQSLEDANGSIVNMDYFPVKITTLPTNPSTGQQFTADEFLDYFRRNINFFTDGGGTTFEPYCENVSPSICQQETDLWNSNDPTGALIYLDIISDDGVVICSEFHNDYWYFMTMNAPYAGNHPVSGTRQFGYELNADGSYNFFVRGVDRFNSFIQSDVAQAFSGVDPFLAADVMWYAFQTNMNDFVNNNGGNSTIGTDVKNRPDWDKVKDVLLGNRPISDLGCN